MKDNNVLLKLHKKRVLAMTGIWLTSTGLSVLFVLTGWPHLVSFLQNIEGWQKGYTVAVFATIFVVGFFVTDFVNRIVQKRITRAFDKSEKR